MRISATSTGPLANWTRYARPCPLRYKAHATINTRAGPPRYAESSKGPPTIRANRAAKRPRPAVELLLFHFFAAALVAAGRVHRRVTLLRNGSGLLPMMIVPCGEPACRGACKEDGPDDEDRSRDDPNPC